jgi:hypothetical protein
LTWQPKFNPFYLSRKAARFQERIAESTCPIKSIIKIESVPTQCIAVDCGDATEETDFRKSFLFGEGFIPTHNTIINSGCTKVINATPDPTYVAPDEDPNNFQDSVGGEETSFVEFEEVKEEHKDVVEEQPKEEPQQPTQEQPADDEF